MSILFTTAKRDAPVSDPDIARSTIDVVEPGTPAAMADHAPDLGEIVNDPNPDIEGLPYRRSLGSEWNERHKVPVHGDGRTAAEGVNSVINARQASNGYAAGKEAAEGGRPTVPWAVGVAPVIVPGTAFGEDYFTVEERDPQELAGRMMAPPFHDGTLSGVVSARGRENARQAASSADAADWLSALMDRR